MIGQRLLPPLPAARASRRRLRGFTLIELMVTVAVVAIFSTLAAPSFRQLIATQRVRSAASALNESLWIARSEAVKRNTNVTFKLATGTVVGWDVVEGTTGAGTSLHHQDGFSAISATTSTGNDLLYTFNPYGRLATGTNWVRFQVGSTGVYRLVCVSTTGRTTVKEAASC